MRSYPLSDPNTSYSANREAGGLTIDVGSEPLHAIDSVIVLEIEGTPQVEPTVITQADDGSITLDYYAAVTAGQAAKRFNRKGLFHISKWRVPQDEVAWHVNVASPGAYQVSIEYAANPEWQGHSFVLQSGTQELSGDVTSTAGSAEPQASPEPDGDDMGDCSDDCIGTEYEYQAFPLGTLELAGGEQIVRIRPAGEVSQNLMHLRLISLKPAE